MPLIPISRRGVFGTLLILAPALIPVLSCESIGIAKRPLFASLRTDSAEIGVQRADFTYFAKIGYVFTNTTAKPISIAMCGHWPGHPHLEKKVDGRWVAAYYPFYLACRTMPDFRFEKGATYRGVLDFQASEPGRNLFPRFELDSIDGVYRLRWTFTEGSDATAPGARRVEALSNDFRMVLREQREDRSK